MAWYIEPAIGRETDDDIKVIFGGIDDNKWACEKKFCRGEPYAGDIGRRYDVVGFMIVLRSLFGGEIVPALMMISRYRISSFVYIVKYSLMPIKRAALAHGTMK